MAEPSALRVLYTLRSADGRLVAFVERDLADLLLAHILPKGVGVFKTQAQVETVIRQGVAEAFDALRQGA